MKSRLLNFSLALNLLLLGMLAYWERGGLFRPRKPSANTAMIEFTEASAKSSRDASTTSAVPGAHAPLHWNELESEDYPTYVANLRKAGCPEVVLRRIISAELKELYARKAFALVQDFHRDFWNIAARENAQQYYEKALKQQVVALYKEPDVLLKELVGDAPVEPSNVRSLNVPDNGFTDFLPASKQEELRRIAERYEAALQAAREADLSSEEKESKLAKLRQEMESEEAQVLSPQEWAEYQLRRSGATKELQQLYGVDFDKTELHALAKALNEYRRQAANEADIAPEMLDQMLQVALGPTRFTELNRARSATYRELYELVSDFGQPSETAAQIFDLRLQSEKRSDEIRADKSRSPAEKQALLDDLQDQVEQTVLTKLGTGAYKSYKVRDGRWINSLGRL